MARQNGRDLRIKRGATVIAVVNTKTVNIANTPVDVTGDDDAGFVTYLDRAGTKQISLDVSGFTDDVTLRDVAVLGTGLLAEPKQVDAFAEMIAMLYDQPALSRRFGAAGRHYVEREYGLDRMLERYAALYSQFASK